MLSKNAALERPDDIDEGVSEGFDEVDVFAVLLILLDEHCFELSLAVDVVLEHFQDRHDRFGLRALHLDLLLFQTEDHREEDRLLELVIPLNERLFEVVYQDVLDRFFSLAVFFLIDEKLAVLVNRD